MILDTNAVSALFAGDPGLERVLADRTGIVLPAVVLGEYRFGLVNSRAAEVLVPLLEEIERNFPILVVDQHTARSYAALKAKLKGKGRPIPENDCWIAALGLQHRMPVVSRDRHFDEVEGIRRIGW